MIRLRVADTEKNAPPEIELIPETFDELYERVDEINKAEYPRKCVSYYMPLNKNEFSIVLLNSNGSLMGYYSFKRNGFEICGSTYGIFGIEDGEHKIYKVMSIKRLYYIAKGFLEGERLG